jgi:hypothetical protein
MRATRGASAKAVEEHLDELLRLIADGMTMRQACESDPRFPPHQVFAVQTRINPIIRARYLEAKDLWKVNRSPAGKYFERIIALIESGMSIAEACTTDPLFPHPDTFYQVTIRKPDRAARLAEAMRKRDADPEFAGQRSFTEAEWNAALDAIRNCADASIASALVAPLPSQNTLLARCRRDPAFSDLYQAAMNARPDPRLHRPAAYQEALDQIAAHPSLTIEAALSSSSERLPSAASLFLRARHDAVFRTAAAAVFRARKQERRRLTAKPVYHQHMLASGLALNEFYAIAEKAVSRGFEPADREDIKSELVLALLAGEISPEQAPRMGREFAHRFFKPQNRQRFRSLDTAAFGEDGSRMAFVDTFSADNWEAA